MLRVMIGFLQGLLTLAKPWWAWLFLLMLVNLLLPLVFLGTPEAHRTLFAFFVAFGIQVTIFRFRGFVRLLGVGHILAWVPLVLWLWTRLGALDTGTPFGQWILAVILLNGISLVIDVIDVSRYLAGDRTPSVTLEELSKGGDHR